MRISYCAVILGMTVAPLASAAPVEKKSPSPAAPAVSAQKLCPVTGEPIKESLHVDYNGVRIYFCCQGCINRFKENPAKYLPAPWSEMYPQKVQVTCPVMGGPVDPKISTEYKGRRVYFCCKPCIEEFNANPGKFARKLQESFTDQVHDPVTGGPVKSEFSTEYEGRDVYFGSKESLEKFEADPAKYRSGALPQVGVLARGATADADVILCPKCGDRPASEKLRKDVHAAVHDGNVYFLCGSACAEAFKSDPKRYAKAVRAEMKKRAPSKEAASETTRGDQPKSSHQH